MKALQLAIVVLFTLLMGFQPAHADRPLITSETAILIDAGTGVEIFSKNPDRRMFPASTTKVMTLLLALEHGDLDEVITIGNEVNMIAWDSSRAHLRPGDRISLRDLLYGLMLASGNDAAYTAAVHVARIVADNPNLSEKQALSDFANLMNQRAKELGASNTNFVNPDGYPHRNHYTTARDLALIKAEAMKNPEYRDFDSTAHYTPESVNQRWNNGNFLIRTDREFFYDKAIGGKTGYTVPAGFTMVATAATEDMELVAVAMKTDANGRWSNTTNMFEYGFENFVTKPLLAEGETVGRVNISDTEETGNLVTQGEVYGTLPTGAVGEIVQEIVLKTDTVNGDLVNVPDQDEVVGEIIFFLNQQEVGRGTLIFQERNGSPIIDWIVGWLSIN